MDNATTVAPQSNLNKGKLHQIIQTKSRFQYSLMQKLFQLWNSLTEKKAVYLFKSKTPIITKVFFVLLPSDHYDRMESELGKISVEAEEDKFEAAMRLASMEIKLNSFDKAAKKTTEIFPTTKEVEEHEEHEEHQEFDSSKSEK
jgi:hypothetical protein